jgi:hypothetical protein
MGVPEQELHVVGTVSELTDTGALTRAEATQGAARIVRRGRGEIRIPGERR